MEIKNCEQYVLAELEAAQRENDELRDRIAELEREAAESDARKGESPDGEVDPRQMQIYKLNEPFETAYLTEELERFGLDLLKKRLLEYADKLDAEAAKSEGDE